MINRRSFLGAAAGAGVLALVPHSPAQGAGKGAGKWTRTVSANGWQITPTAISTYRVEGSGASVALRQGAAAVLLHVARRWHYEIAPLDTGEGGGIVGYTTRRTVQADFESNYLSGTAMALHPTAYPAGGSERLWPHHEAIVRDILVDCEGTVIWGGDLRPAKASHFQLVARPGDKALARVSARLDASEQTNLSEQTAGAVADPATSARRDRARRMPRPR
ncbi:twin-arginine translocation signal domain-containing protein [Micromonospora sp. LOL_024]|uniref:twin-arginine translocation signal domain-containing protein n=1 Tax=Micromonospora sp. LOL_024 TaxID=3345412 RepID=UPI003A8A9576